MKIVVIICRWSCFVRRWLSALVAGGSCWSLELVIGVDHAKVVVRVCHQSVVVVVANGWSH